MHLLDKEKAQAFYPIHSLGSDLRVVMAGVAHLTEAGHEEVIAPVVGGGVLLDVRKLHELEEGDARDKKLTQGKESKGALLTLALEAGTVKTIFPLTTKSIPKRAVIWAGGHFGLGSSSTRRDDLKVPAPNTQSAARSEVGIQPCKAKVKTRLKNPVNPGSLPVNTPDSDLRP